MGQEKTSEHPCLEKSTKWTTTNSHIHVVHVGFLSVTTTTLSLSFKALALLQMYDISK